MCEWDSSAPGGRSCRHEHRAHLHYDARLEPRCHQPEQYRHWGLYEVLQQQLRCHRRPAQPVSRARAQLHPEAEDVDYLAAPDAAVVLLEDRLQEDDYGDYAAAGIADDQLAMAEYAADDYVPELDLEPEPEPETEVELEPEPEYVTIPPEQFAKLSKKAQKLELERMNPKFRRHYNL